MPRAQKLALSYRGAGQDPNHTLICLGPQLLPGFLRPIPNSYVLWPKENGIILSKLHFIYGGVHPFQDHLRQCFLSFPLPPSPTFPARRRSTQSARDLRFHQKVLSSNQPGRLLSTSHSDPCTLETPGAGEEIHLYATHVRPVVLRHAGVTQVPH